jgi:hypothetical protein
MDATKEQTEFLAPPVFAIGQGGWVEVGWARRPGILADRMMGFFRYLVRLSVRTGGRLVVTDLLLLREHHGLDDLSSPTQLQQLRLSEVAAWANSSDVRPLIYAALDQPGDINVEVRSPERRRRPRPLTFNVGQTPAGWLGALPEGPKYPDDFYERLAREYENLVLVRLPPLRTIAESYGVPHSTVGRWVREARRRKFLAPARTKGHG